MVLNLSKKNIRYVKQFNYPKFQYYKRAIQSYTHFAYSVYLVSDPQACDMTVKNYKNQRCLYKVYEHNKVYDDISINTIYSTN